MALKDLSAMTMAVMFLVTGLWHLWKPRFFLSITPPWVPWPRLANAIATTVELSLVPGLLWPVSRVWAAHVAVALLVAVFPVHLDMLRPGRGQGQPPWFLWSRLPLQVILIGWALFISFCN